MNDQEAVREPRMVAESAYRRGWTQGADEAARVVLQLTELGFRPTVIRRLFAVYEDHVLAPWRAGDLDTREAPPTFDVQACQDILKGTTGYDWII